MKKFAAVIAASVLAAAIPLTASAATIIEEDFSEEHKGVWSPSEYFTNVSNGMYDLAKGNLSKTMALNGDYAFTFDITTGDESIDGVYVKIQSKDNIEYVNILDVAVNSGSARVRNIDGSYTTAKTTDNGGTERIMYMAKNTTYTCTVTVTGNEATLDIDGQFTNGLDFTPITATIPDHSSADTTITFFDHTGKTKFYLDNITITTPDEPADVEPTATTEHVSAQVEGSFEVGGTTITTEGDVVSAGDKDVHFYKTTITAGTNDVNGGKIKAELDGKSIENDFSTAVKANDTGVFYNAVCVADGADVSGIAWSYTFN